MLCQWIIIPFKVAFVTGIRTKHYAAAWAFEDFLPDFYLFCSSKLNFSLKNSRRNPKHD